MEVRISIVTVFCRARRVTDEQRATGNEAGTHSGTARWWQIVIEAVKRRVAVVGEKPGRRRFSPGKVEQRWNEFLYRRWPGEEEPVFSRHSGRRRLRESLTNRRWSFEFACRRWKTEVATRGNSFVGFCWGYPRARTARTRSACSLLANHRFL